MMESMSFWSCNIQGIFLYINFTLVTRKWEKECTHRVGNSKWNFLFLNLELVTRKRKNKSLTTELVTRIEIKYFPNLS